MSRLALRRRPAGPEPVDAEDATTVEQAEGLDVVLAPVGLRPATPRVNLLPPEIAAARRLRLVKTAAGGAVLLTAGLVAVLTISASGAVSDAGVELAEAQARQAVAAGELAALSDVRAVYADVQARETLLVRAMGAEVRWSGALTDLSLTLPSGVWMTGVTVAQDVDGLGSGTPADGLGAPGLGSVTFTGSARTHDDVAAFLESLATRPGYANPYFTASSERFVGEVAVVDFTASVSVGPDALEGRYVVPTGGTR